MRPPQKTDWPSLVQLALALLVIAGAWSLAALLFFLGVISLVSRQSETGDPLQLFMLAAALLATGLLLAPSVYYAIMRLFNRPAWDSRPLIRHLRPGWWIFAFPLVLAVGNLSAQAPMFSWLVLPWLHLAAVGLPTFWILYLGLRKLPLGSPQRMWGVFGSGLTLAPFLILILEMLAALGFIFLFVVYFAARPDLVERLTEIARQLQETESPELALEILAPAFSNPLVVAAIIIFGAVVVPLIEELIKPVGVWLLLGKKLTPAAGFAAGALSGAGYGFIESLVLTSSGQEWGSLVIARLGTSAVHIFTTALTGWALVQAWRKKKFRQLALAYLCAVVIHGLWNGLTLAFSFQMVAVSENLTLNLPLIKAFGATAPAALAMLAMGCFFGLIAANLLVQRQAQAGPVGARPPE